MIPEPHTTLEKLTKKDYGIRVDFYWLGDRFGHTISAVRDGETTVVWRSVDDDEFGPVYQELHEQTVGDRSSILFLSGASAGAHWSASVEFEEAGCYLTFDVAARVTTEPTNRVIEYRAESDGKPALRCSSDECEITEAPLVTRFEAMAANHKLPATLRFKYTFISP